MEKSQFSNYGHGRPRNFNDSRFYRKESFYDDDGTSKTNRNSSSRRYHKSHNNDNGQGFHKTAGGDYQRMPQSVVNKILVPQKLSPGTEGTKVELIGNFYRFVHSKISAYHYDVMITKIFKRSQLSINFGDEQNNVELCEQFIKKFSQIIMNEWISVHKDIFQDVYFVYDGYKNCYTTQPLKIAKQCYSDSVNVNIEGKLFAFMVAFKLVDQVPLGAALDYYQGNSTESIPEHIISVFEIIFRSVFSKNFLTYRRNFFDATQINQSPQCKLVNFIQGFSNSVQMTEFGLALNVHLKTSCTIASSFTKLSQLVCTMLNISEHDLDNIKGCQLYQINKIIRHVRVMTRHTNREHKYIVDSLLDKKPKYATFEHNGQQISIYDYFKQEYNIRVEKWPLVKCSGKKSVYLPLDLCYLLKSQFLDQQKFDTAIRNGLLFNSTHKPNHYFHKVTTFIKNITCSDANGVLNKFGIELDRKAARFDGRVLPRPKAIATIQRDKLYSTPMSVKWTLFMFNDRSERYKIHQLKRFSCQLMDTARNLGLKMNQPHSINCVRIRNIKDIDCVFHNVVRKTNSEVVLVGIPNCEFVYFFS